MLSRVDEMRAEHGVNLVVLGSVVKSLSDVLNRPGAIPLAERIEAELAKFFDNLRDADVDPNYRKEMQAHMQDYLSELLTYVEPAMV